MKKSLLLLSVSAILCAGVVSCGTTIKPEFSESPAPPKVQAQAETATTLRVLDESAVKVALEANGVVTIRRAADNQGVFVRLVFPDESFSSLWRTEQRTPERDAAGAYLWENGLRVSNLPPGSRVQYRDAAHNWTDAAALN